MHVYRSDDEAWHVLESSPVFEFPDGEAEALAGTTVFVPAGTPHTYREPDSCLVFLAPRLDRLISELHSSPEETRLPEILARYDTEQVHHRTPGARQGRQKRESGLVYSPWKRRRPPSDNCHAGFTTHLTTGHRDGSVH